MIIGLIGKKRVGKDTVAGIIRDIYIDRKKVFKMMALADPIKDIARIMFNFTESQLYDNEKDVIDTRWNIKPRDFFEQFGTEIMQYDIYKYLPNLQVPERKFWVLSLLSKIRQDDNVEDNIIITDVRGQHEVDEIIKFNPNAIFIHITRPSLHKDAPAPNESSQVTHITQQEPDSISANNINHYIVNDGTIDELREKIKEILPI